MQEIIRDVTVVVTRRILESAPDAACPASGALRLVPIDAKQQTRQPRTKSINDNKNDHQNRLMRRVSVAGQERVPLRRRGKQLAGRHRHWHTAVLIVVLLARSIFTVRLLASSLARVPHLPSQRRVNPFTSFMSDLDDTSAESAHTQEEQGLGQLDDSRWGFVAVDFGPITSGVATSVSQLQPLP